MPIKKNPTIEAPKARIHTDLEVNKYGVGPVVERPTNKVVKSVEHAKELADKWTDYVNKLDDRSVWENYLSICDQINQVGFINLGYKPSMENLGESYNHEKLLGAARCVVLHYGLIQQLTPLAVRDIDLGELSTDVQWLEFLRALYNMHMLAAERSLVLLSQVQKSVDQRVRQVGTVVLPVLPTIRELRDLLTPLGELIKGPSEDGVETKKIIAKAATKEPTDKGGDKGGDKEEPSAKDDTKDTKEGSGEGTMRPRVRLK